MPEEISGADISSYAFELKNSGRAASTVHRKMASVRSYCLYLTGEGILEENPARNIRPPRMEKKEIEYLSIQEVEAILNAPDDSVKGLRDRAILEMMYGTGIRVTEISSLRMSDVNFRIGFITCTGEYGKARIIPLGRPCREALERYLDESRPKLLESYLRRRAEQEMSGTESADDRDAGQKRISAGVYLHELSRRTSDPAGIVEDCPHLCERGRCGETTDASDSPEFLCGTYGAERRRSQVDSGAHGV